MEIVTKICKEYPNIDVKWLIFGNNELNPTPTQTHTQPDSNPKNEINSEVEKIILLLKDGTFKEFKN